MDQTELVYRAEQVLKQFSVAGDIELGEAEPFLREAHGKTGFAYRQAPTTYLDIVEPVQMQFDGMAESRFYWPIGECRSDGVHVRPGYLSRYVLLHELAHWLTDDGHGPKFGAVYLELVGAMFGSTTAGVLRRSLVEHGASVAPAHVAEAERDAQEMAWLRVKFEEDETSPGFEDDSDLDH